LDVLELKNSGAATSSPFAFLHVPGAENSLPSLRRTIASFA
jgi:hypothetical protein